MHLLALYSRTMVTQLVQHERICTTLPKAVALQRYADRLITLSKRVSACTDADGGCHLSCHLYVVALHQHALGSISVLLC